MIVHGIDSLKSSLSIKERPYNSDDSFSASRLKESEFLISAYSEGNQNYKNVKLCHLAFTDSPSMGLFEFREKRAEQHTQLSYQDLFVLFQNRRVIY